MTSALLAGCGSSDSGAASEAAPAEEEAADYDVSGVELKVWVADNTVDFTNELIDQFKSENPEFEAVTFTVEAVGESDAANNMITDVESGADVFTFAQDQLSRLVTAGALEEVAPDNVAGVEADNSEAAVNAATVGDILYAYPITADNTYFLYYDKSVVTDPTSLEAIVADCEAAGKNFYMEINSGWYQTAFFFGTGCNLLYETDDQGNFVGATVDYASDAGVVALKEMIELKASKSFQNGSSAGDATDVAAIVDGTWDAETVKQLFGDNYATATLPKFQGADGNEYQLSGFSGYKLIGVKPQEDEAKLYVCDALAAYMSSSAAQLARFNAVGWGPASLEAQKDEAVMANEAVSAALFFGSLGRDLKEIGTTFIGGDWKTKISYIIMGFGPIMRGQIVRGLAFLGSEALFIWYLMGFGLKYIKDFSTLGTVATHKVRRKTVYGDNSFLILLFSLLTIIIICFFIFIWRMNVRENLIEETALKSGKPLMTNRKFLSSFLDDNFHFTLLSLPVLGIFVFTVLPIIFMISVAFTNYDKNHQSPTNLFTWVGLDNFKELLSFSSTGFGSTFVTILVWTLLWAFFATFIDYFLGLAVAMLINKKGIRFKKLWRTILVVTIAVPQFVSLLYISKMFANDGLINSYLLRLGIIESAIPFWTNPTLAKITIIVINIWIGIPYMMLIATGLLMNIPSDLYESAELDGANAWQMFRHITLPYMLFVTGPFLLTQFTGNLNNFNVIYLLSQGGPQSIKLNGNAGYTDLLVTWLYKMTVNDINYKMAAVIGIMVFVVTAVTSLVVYNALPSVRDEEGFQ